MIYTNGELDPWSYGGLEHIQNSTTAAAISACTPPPLTSILIENAAHHEDLRAPLESDPPALVAARVKIVSLLAEWLNADYDLT